MRKSAILMAVALTAIFSVLHAGEDNSTMLIKNWQDDEARPKVEDDRSNIYQEYLQDKKANLSGTPKGCLAAQVTDTEHKIEWQPRWHYYGNGGPRLPDAKISPDKSILAIVENTGRPNGPSGSRIVLFNVYNFKIARIIELPEQKIGKICFIPETAYLACFAESQKCFKQNMRLIAVDLASGKSSGEAILPEPVVCMAGTERGEKFFVRTESGKVLIFNITDLAGKPKILENSGKGKCMAVNAAREELVLPVDGKIKMFNLDTFTPNAFAEVDLPGDFSPDEIAITSRDNCYALLEKGRKMLWIRGRSIREITNDPGNVMDFDSSTNMLAAGMRFKQALQLFKLPEASEQKEVIPGALRPRTSGDIIMLAFTMKPMNILVLDSHGNFYLMEKSGRRWGKELLVAPKK